MGLTHCMMMMFLISSPARDEKGGGKRISHNRSAALGRERKGLNMVVPKQQQQRVRQDLWKEQAKAEPDPETCRNLLDCLAAGTSTSQDDVRKLLTACQKTFRLQRRNNDNGAVWDDLLQLVKQRMEESKKEEEEEDEPADGEEEEDDESSLPRTVSQYLHRLKQHKKDLYKNPPVLPPSSITVYKQRAELPKRNPKTGRLSFTSAKSSDNSEDDKAARLIREQFRPNTTPEEVLRLGAFGGTYFRPIHSAVTNRSYRSSDVLQDTVDPAWISGLNKKQYLTSSTYHAAVNKFGVKCGGSLGMWESSGWISDADPYGWFQWYCRFYQGRRSSDDARQIQRWLGVAGPKGRFKSQLCNKILAAAANVDDASISPVIRQSLLHWGLQITTDVLEQHKKR